MVLKKIISVFVKIINKTFLRKVFLSIFIFSHNASYDLIKLFVNEPGKRPVKHVILNHFEFFEKNVNKNDVVLDLGCGTGELSKHISKKVKKVVGIEILNKKIKVAKKQNQTKNTVYVQGDATTFDFKKIGIKKIDAIILSNVLEHIEDRISFLKKISKLSDKILLRVPLITRDWLSVYKKENGYYYKLDPTHYTEYRVEEIEEELKKSGWKIKTYHTKFGEFYGVITKK